MDNGIVYKHIRKIFCLSVAACVGIFGLFVVACNNEEQSEKPPLIVDNCEVVAEDTLYGAADGGNDFIAVCNSFGEFKRECLRNGYDFFDKNNEYNYYDTIAGETLRGYTDVYFADKAFVVCAFYRSSWGGQYRIQKVNVTENKLTLYIRYPESETEDDVINRMFLVAGVDKSLVYGVTEVIKEFI
ncbi:MAG: hypothetical protein K2L42_03890 [Clostridia bacterium]|nr:hypothetical protein [Clostridia bacterium]